uniref:Rab-GAP TBC domain-containing protein n=1 Tax=Vitis vinifera TaxID=29760 RepID=F6HQV6_VITVI
MKDEQIGRNHPPSIEEDFEEVLSFNLISDDSGNESLEASAAANGISPEPFFPWKKELVCLVRGGLPKALRGEVWQAFVGARKRRMERYYQNLIASETNAGEGKDYGSSLSVNGSKQPNADHAIPEKWRRQIEKDLPRTFPGHPALDKVGRDSLRHLLLAHAQHNPSVGYCQIKRERLSASEFSPCLVGGKMTCIILLP